MKKIFLDLMNTPEGGGPATAIVCIISGGVGGCWFNIGREKWYWVMGERCCGRHH